MAFGNPEGATFNCPKCAKLLIQIEGKVRDFHAYMNEQDPRWPKDGVGTGWVEV